MAKLNDNQKNRLDKVVLSFLNDLDSEECLTTSLLEKATEEMQTRIIVQNLLGSFNRLLSKGYKIDVENGTLFIKKKRAFIESAKKEKNFIYFYDKDNNKIDNFYLDFATQTFIHEPDDENAIENYHFALNLVPLLSKEWIFNYINLNYSALVRNTSPTTYSFSDKCPKGFANYIKNKDYTSLEELDVICSDYELELKYGSIYTAACSYFYNWEKHTVRKIFKLGYSDVSKMIINSVKNGDFLLQSLQSHSRNNERFNFAEFLEHALTYDFKIDTNRDFIHNSKNLYNLVNIEKHNKLAEKLKKLNFLNGLTFEDFTVVVPQTIEDLQNEGSQQNNCVGYYYNNSIVAGDNLIYFLRKTDNTNKSVITCRFHLSTQATTEARRINNSSISREDDKIIKNIDAIIRKNLRF